MPKYTNMLVYFALGDAKVWRWGSKPTPGPNANGFASQWNIGLSVFALSIPNQAFMTHFGLSGILNSVLTLIWAILAYDKPEDHPRISPEETALLLESLPSSNGKVVRCSFIFLLINIHEIT